MSGDESKCLMGVIADGLIKEEVLSSVDFGGLWFSSSHFSVEIGPPKFEDFQRTFSTSNSRRVFRSALTFNDRATLEAKVESHLRHKYPDSHRLSNKAGVLMLNSSRMKQIWGSWRICPKIFWAVLLDGSSSRSFRLPTGVVDQHWSFLSQL